MNEAQTRLDKIDPKLRDAGWGIVPGSKIHSGTVPFVYCCVEQSLLCPEIEKDVQRLAWLP